MYEELSKENLQKLSERIAKNNEREHTCDIPPPATLILSESKSGVVVAAAGTVTGKITV